MWKSSASIKFHAFHGRLGGARGLHRRRNTGANVKGMEMKFAVGGAKVPGPRVARVSPVVLSVESRLIPLEMFPAVRFMKLRGKFPRN